MGHRTSNINPCKHGDLLTMHRIHHEGKLRTMTQDWSCYPSPLGGCGTHTLPNLNLPISPRLKMPFDSFTKHPPLGTRHLSEAKKVRIITWKSLSGCIQHCIVSTKISTSQCHVIMLTHLLWASCASATCAYAGHMVIVYATAGFAYTGEVLEDNGEWDSTTIQKWCNIIKNECVTMNSCVWWWTCSRKYI